MSTSFDRDAVRVFRFVRAQFDAASGEARLVYAFDDGEELVESLVFPGAPFVLDVARARAVEQALRQLHLLAGVSYYKAPCRARSASSRTASMPIPAHSHRVYETDSVSRVSEWIVAACKVRFPVAAPARQDGDRE